MGNISAFVKRVVALFVVGSGMYFVYYSVGLREPDYRLYLLYSGVGLLIIMLGLAAGKLFPKNVLLAGLLVFALFVVASIIGYIR